jgi:very-short-patch-repair endonuclease
MDKTWSRLRNNTRPRSIESKERSRTQRKEMTASERVLWERIKRDQLGFRFRRQHRVLQYFLDFYCPEAMLCVEVDGELHALRADRDAKRDMELKRLGIETLRIPSMDLFDANTVRAEKWVRLIVERCRARTGRGAEE